ncbi:hypothetical protein U5922_007690 [Aquicoccus sp. G2-2]|uniref:hypothetical protein n=1 Tax=Aquicoccus sp. G2-2 TaxID=3092120 RepID=UPI002AE05743|nr:hypothetical protein [Aquicoccus sp. G2-2]MEA1113363.1 hypothetical protein [Aquicoccus sp. G2-2]
MAKPTPLPKLEPDCAACAAYCCVSLAFDKGPRFPFSKPAGTPCRHLERHKCAIHDDLDARGFSGCIAYQCTGAGQRTLALYDGKSWRDDPALLAPQSETFRALRALHTAISHLVTAAALPLPPVPEARRTALLARLCPDRLTPALAARLASGPLLGEVNAFLKSLPAHLPPEPRPDLRPDLHPDAREQP